MTFVLVHRILNRFVTNCWMVGSSNFSQIYQTECLPKNDICVGPLNLISVRHQVLHNSGVENSICFKFTKWNSQLNNRGPRRCRQGVQQGVQQKSGHHRPASETPCVSLADWWWPNNKWWLGNLVIFQGYAPVFLRNPINLWFSKGRVQTPQPSLDPRMLKNGPVNDASVPTDCIM